MQNHNTQIPPTETTPAIQFRQVSAEQREKLVAGIVRRQIERNTQVGPYEVRHMRGAVPYLWVELMRKNFSEALALVKTAPGRVYDSRTRLWAVPTEWYMRKMHRLEEIPNDRRLGDLLVEAAFGHVYHEAGCEAHIRMHGTYRVGHCNRDCDAYWKAKGF